MITKVTSGDLVAVRVAPGQQWPKILRAVWTAGGAVLPVDIRLPDRAAHALVNAMRPTMLLDERGLTRLSDGHPADGLALVMCTSGTTGAPKGVEVTHSMLAAALQGSEALLGVHDDDRWMCCLPVAHMGGMLAMLRGMKGGGSPLVLASFDAASVRRSGATHTSVVPAVAGRLAGAGGFRAILVGGASARALGAPFVRTYGMTETCGGVAYDGKCMPGVEVRFGAGGEIEVRGPQVARRYRLGPDIAEWLPTGDVGRQVDGVLEVLGRMDDCINTGGENVWPSAVEAVLLTHAAIADCRVVGEPDAEWGQRVVAVVVPADRAPELDEIREHVAASLPRFCAPRELRVVEMIERTTNGKPMRG